MAAQFLYIDASIAEDEEVLEKASEAIEPWVKYGGWEFVPHASMPGQLRIEYPGAVYHIMNRGGSPGGRHCGRCGPPRFIKTDWQIQALRNQPELGI